jgi:hypothetical protein
MNNYNELPSGRILDLMVKNVSRNDPLTIEEVGEIKTIRPLLSKEQWTKWLQYAREEKYNRSLKSSNQIINENTNIASSSPRIMSNPAKKISPPKVSPSKSNNSRGRHGNNVTTTSNIINSPPRLNQLSQNINNDDSFEIENNVAIIEDFVNQTTNSSPSPRLYPQTSISTPPRLNQSLHSDNNTPRLNKSSNNIVNSSFEILNNSNRIDIVTDINNTPRLNKSSSNIVNNSFDFHHINNESIHSPSKPFSPPKLYPSTKYRHKFNENSSTISTRKQSPTKSFPYFSPSASINKQRKYQMNQKSELDSESLFNNYDIDIHKAIALAHSTGTRIESIYSVAKCLMTFLEDENNDNIGSMGK